MDAFAFLPDPVRTAHIDLAIRMALADSAGRVLDAAADFGLTPDDERWCAARTAWRAALLAGARVPPRVWACYHVLVQAVARADGAAVGALAPELIAMLPAPAARPGIVVALADRDLGPVDTARYRSIIDSDPAQPLDLVPVSHDETVRLTILAQAARALTSEAAPALRDEIDTLGHQIVLATSCGSRAFGGAASLFLWGAVVLNPARVEDRTDLVEALAHETAHALLFGLTGGADLTTNDPSERYASPLRPDPRPIEGIVHATYVLARMMYALEALMGSGQLNAKERETVAARLKKHRTSYAAGVVTVRSHARFTENGAKIFRACENATAE